MVMRDEVLKILSLGAGVQSTTVLLMSCKGELPKLDCAIFADTGWEPKAVYKHFEWLKAESEKHGIPVRIVQKGNLKHDAARIKVSKEGKKYIPITLPLHLINEQGERGMMRARQCTFTYKVEVIERELRILAGIFKKRSPDEPVVEEWIGISTDEVRRARVSTKPWLDMQYPLITEVPMSRRDCLNWLQKNYPEINTPRSACIGCPYHSNEEWRYLRDNSPDEFQSAIEYDELIRGLYEEAGKLRNGGKVYLHKDAVPLSEANLEEKDNNADQLSLFDQECMGMCNT